MIPLKSMGGGLPVMGDSQFSYTGVKGDIVLRDYSPPSVDRNGIKRDTSVACRVGGLYFTVQPGL